MARVATFKELLASANAGALQASHDLQAAIGAGSTEVTWTAWQGAPGQSPVVASRTARVYVFPFGQTPAGLTADDRSTASNHSPKVVRDGDGKAHMVWLDSGRPGVGSRVMYRRAAVDSRSGALAWEAEPVRVSDPSNELWNGYPVIAASGGAIHVAWAAGDGVRYRRLARSAGAWTFEPTRHTRLMGPGEDWGPSLTARTDDEIHLMTPSGRYGLSRDAGATWASDAIPVPQGLHMKGPAMAVDPEGNAHFTFTGKVRSSQNWKYGQRNASYWQLRYVRRAAAGGWVDAQDMLSAFPEWRDAPGTPDDVLADFSDVYVDREGHVHVAWHGSAVTRAYGYDETFYLRRPRTAPGTWGPWETPQSLSPHDPATADYFSYAPALAFDGPSRVVLAVLFYDTVPSAGTRFDVALRPLRDGRIDGPRVLLTRSARDPIAAGRPAEAWSTWFPCPGRQIYRDAEGRAWLDVVQTVVTSLDYKQPHHIVYLRRDVTSLVAPRR